MRMKLLLIGVVILAMLGLFALILFGPSAGATLTRKTTFIRSPLAKDGLPNYALAMLEEQRDGVTRENNGAVLFWQAVGPMGMQPEQFRRLSQELSIADGGPASYLSDADAKEIRDQLIAWIKSKHDSPPTTPVASDVPGNPIADPSLADSAEWPIEPEVIADEVLRQARTCPWRTEDIPPLAAWVEANKVPLDLLVAAAAKPRFYSPSPNLLTNPNTSLIEALLPHAQGIRYAAIGLTTRALFRTGHGQYAEAWQDCLACWRLGSQVATGPTVVERLVGIAVRSVAKDATLALLQCNDLPQGLPKQILSDLNSLPPNIKMADAFDHAERYMYLDQTLRQLTGRLGGDSGVLGSEMETPSRLFAFNVDEPLKIGNAWYDRIVAAAAMDDSAGRQEAMDQIDADVAKLAGGVKSGLFGALFSRQKRSEVMGNIMVTMLLPALKAAVDAEDRDASSMGLVRIAAALAVHRADHDAYPEALTELAPSVLADIPHDPYSDKLPIYQRRGDGYLLYSVYQNGVDDRGRDLSGSIVGGEWLPQADQQRVNQDEADLVFRVPHPPLHLPMMSPSPKP